MHRYGSIFKINPSGIEKTTLNASQPLFFVGGRFEAIFGGRFQREAFFVFSFFICASPLPCRHDDGLKDGLCPPKKNKTGISLSVLSHY